MTRRKAWLLAGIITVAVVALIVGIGATFGQFGFSGSDQVNAAPDPTPALSQQGSGGSPGFLTGGERQTEHEHSRPGGDGEHEESREDD